MKKVRKEFDITDQKLSSYKEKYKGRLQKSADILVTGGTGFIGRALLNELVNKGKRVRALCRQNNSIEALPNEVALNFGDMRNRESIRSALQGIKIVYHCAAAMKGDWADFYETTVLGTQNLLNELDNGSVEKLIYISTLGIIDYNQLKENSVIDELSPIEEKPDKRGFYTHSKFLAELLVSKFSENSKKVKTTILRPGLVFGKESNKVLNNAGVLIGNNFFVFGCGHRFLGLNYIENLVDAIIQLDTVNYSNGEIYHVVDPEQPTVRKYIDSYQKLSNNKLRVFYIPIFIWKSLFLIVDLLLTVKSGKKGTFYYKFASNSKRLYYRSEKLSKTILWQPPYSFEKITKKIY
jgi:nucleoside-diphosphate-sugar epimerase